MHKILVAEDSHALANLIEFVLKSAGFDTRICRTGAAACEAACAEKFSLILLDQQMPKMTGTEVVEALRARGPNYETPVYLCTAKTHELDLDYLRQSLHVTDVFHKPFSPRDLVETLKLKLAQPIECSQEANP